jgi:hypothetical protein
VQSAEELNGPVEVKAVLVDPRTMTILWMNESASHVVSGRDPGSADVTIGQVLPMAEAMGVPEALREVADTGVARHLRTALVSTVKGSVAIVVSIYRVPDGALLVLAENAWRPAHGATGDGTSPHRRRRTR